MWYFLGVLRANNTCVEAISESSENSIFLWCVCLALSLQKGDADAMSLDGGYAYTAGKCGLVPVLAENQSKWR